MLSTSPSSHDDIREAAAKLEEAAARARRVFGDRSPTTTNLGKVLTTLRRCVELNDQGVVYTCKMIPRSVFADTCPGTLLTEWDDAETGEPMRQDQARRGAGRARGGRG